MSAQRVVFCSITNIPVEVAAYASKAAESGGADSLSTLNPHGACGMIRFVGNDQLQAGRPSVAGAKVRHGMRGQRYARLNFDLHAMTEAPESQTHVVNVVGRVLWHRPIITRSPKRKSPDSR